MRARLSMLVALLAACASVQRTTPPTVVGLAVLVDKHATVAGTHLSPGELAAVEVALTDALARELTAHGLFVVRDPAEPHHLEAKLALTIVPPLQGDPLIYTLPIERYSGEAVLKITTAGGQSDSSAVAFYAQELDHLPAYLANTVAPKLAGAVVNSDKVVAYSVAQQARAVRRAERPVDKKVGSRQGVFRLAVLDLRSYAAGVDVLYFGDRVRSIAFRALPAAEVITRENVVVLLAASGKRIEDCDAECEVETGRRLGADAVISGDLHLIGKSFRLSLRMHETRSGSLTGVAMAEGSDLEQLDAALPAAMGELFKGSR